VPQPTVQRAPTPVEPQPTVQRAHTPVVPQATDDEVIPMPVDNLPPTWSEILPAESRFKVVMGYAAVLDRETGLVWEQSPSTALYTWSGAHTHCNSRVTGGRMGWRLPTFQELASLVDPDSISMLPSGHPFYDIQPFNYWSATTNDRLPGRAWVVFFGVRVEKTQAQPAAKSGELFTWCVRSGHPGVDAQ